MKVSVRRALCAAAGLLAFAGAASAAAPASMAFEPLGASERAAPFSDSYAFSDGAALATSNFAASGVPTSVSLISGLDLELGYKVDLAGRIAPVDMSSSHAFDGLFLSSASNGLPYVSVAGGGSYAGASARLTRSLRVFAGLESITPHMSSSAPDAYTALLRLGGTPTPYAPRAADALLAGISWQPTSWASVGVVGSQSNERNAILANPAPGRNTSTTALGMSARVRFGGGWSTTASYSEGISQFDLRSSLSQDGLRTRSYGIAVAKSGLFGDDSLGIAVSVPTLAADGQFVTMSGAGGTPLLARNHLLEGIGPAKETDVEIGYITTFLDGSLALQTNASFQMNYAGQTGQNAVSLLSRARIKF